MGLNQFNQFCEKMNRFKSINSIELIGIVIQVCTQLPHCPQLRTVSCQADPASPTLPLTFTLLGAQCLTVAYQTDAAYADFSAASQSVNHDLISESSV